MTFLIQQTLIYAVPLMIVALAGVFAERSGIINLALEGIMVFGAFIGVWFVRILQTSDAILSLKQSGNWVALQGVELLTMLVAAAFGALFSLLLSFASINLRADQTIGGTALNLMAPALVLFFIRIIANQNTLQMLTGDAASWFMIKKTTLGFDRSAELAKRALLRPAGSPNPDPFYAEMEQELLERINALGIGPQGLGGRTTALAVHIEVAAVHMASLPVAVNINCHVTRHKTEVL